MINAMGVLMKIEEIIDRLDGMIGFDPYVVDEEAVEAAVCELKKILKAKEHDGYFNGYDDGVRDQKEKDLREVDMMKAYIDGTHLVELKYSFIADTIMKYRKRIEES